MDDVSKKRGYVMETKHVCRDCETPENVLRHVGMGTGEKVWLCCQCGSTQHEYECVEPTVYNIQTGETGYVLTSALDDRWVRVVIHDTCGTTAWLREYVIADWQWLMNVPVAFIKKHITPIWNAYNTLYMYDDAEMVYDLARTLAHDQGEAFNDELVTVLRTWNENHPMYRIIHEYVVEALIDNDMMP